MQVRKFVGLLHFFSKPSTKGETTLHLKIIQTKLTQTESIHSPIQSPLNSDLDLYCPNVVNLGPDQINVDSTSKAVQYSPAPSKKRFYWWM